MTTLFILACILLSSSSSAQVFVEELNLNESEDISIIEVFLRTRYNKGTTVNIDYGQWQQPRVIDFYCLPKETINESNGEQIVFNSKIHALNFFESNGWDLIEINNNNTEESNLINSYYFKKEESNNSKTR